MCNDVCCLGVTERSECLMSEAVGIRSVRHGGVYGVSGVNVVSVARDRNGGMVSTRGGGVSTLTSPPGHTGPSSFHPLGPDCTHRSLTIRSLWSLWLLHYSPLGLISYSPSLILSLPQPFIPLHHVLAMLPHVSVTLTQHQAFTPQCCRLKPWSCWARGLSGSMVG